VNGRRLANYMSVSGAGTSVRYKCACSLNGTTTTRAKSLHVIMLSPYVAAATSTLLDFDVLLCLGLTFL